MNEQTSQDAPDEDLRRDIRLVTSILGQTLARAEGQEERYVVWGEGTTDEMCLGMLQVTRP